MTIPTQKTPEELGVYAKKVKQVLIGTTWEEKIKVLEHLLKEIIAIVNKG